MKYAFFCIGLILTLLTSCSENNTSIQTNATSSPDSLTGKSTYINPADGKTYYTEGEFKEYLPEGGVKQVSGPVRLLNVVLLTEENKIQNAITIERLADFMEGVDNIVIKELASVKESGQIILQFTLYSNKKPKIDLSYSGDLKTKDLSEVSKKVEQFSLATRTDKDSCIFQNLYGVNEKQK